MNYILLPDDMYRKCFGILICWGLTYEPSLTLLGLWRSGVDFGGFGDFGVDPSLSDAVMSFLRLTEASKCIPHPHGMYKKCFGILICWRLTYEPPLTSLGLWRSGVDLGDLGVDLSLSVAVMSFLRLTETEASKCIPHPHGIYRKCFGILICYE